MDLSQGPKRYKELPDLFSSVAPGNHAHKDLEICVLRRHGNLLLTFDHTGVGWSWTEEAR